ncbi:MAG: NUDIX domain-containing protein [Desulfobulbaceae bacterium]|uniref:NUDIX domain-containing protein n=1 Tax=Candidatus Desulfobia pelagia TaxID=2841692 RepID=A0A8J6NF82_9BACT|nr:NUDIX domain-containing protein [Candidatus Desulfobia pelagia]
MDPRLEKITIADEDNNEINQVTRAEMRAGNLIHRATYILVFNSLGYLFVQKRTQSKDIYPGHYEIAAGGVVLAGESYELSAQRELQEELGIKSTALRPLFDNFYDDGQNRVWGRVFACSYNGPLELQETEVESGEFMKIENVLAMMETHPFCPDGIGILKRILDEGLVNKLQEKHT